MNKIKSILIEEDSRLASCIREVKNFGNAAHVTIPKKYIDKKVLVLVLE